MRYWTRKCTVPDRQKFFRQHAPRDNRMWIYIWWAGAPPKASILLPSENSSGSILRYPVFKTIFLGLASSCKRQAPYCRFPPSAPIVPMLSPIMSFFLKTGFPFQFSLFISYFFFFLSISPFSVQTSADNLSHRGWGDVNVRYRILPNFGQWPEFRTLVISL